MTRAPHLVNCHYVTIFTLLALAVATARAELSIEPKIRTVEVGTDSEVECTSSEGDIVSRTWLVESTGEVVNITSNGSRIYFEPETGKLHLNDAELNDTGNFVCVANLTECLIGGAIGINGSWSDLGADCENITFIYKVYVMPDYTTDGIIIGVINGVLLIIFLICVIRSAINDRVRLKKYGQKL